MPERVNPSYQMPGYSAGTALPGSAKKLIVRAQRGAGVAQSEVAEANRAFRLKRNGDGEQPWHPLARDVRSVDEVTRGLGLDDVQTQRIGQAVAETRADGGPSSQTQRIFLAIDKLTTALRAMPEVSSDARMEITRRARAYWMNTQRTDYGKPPTVRAPQRSQAREDTTMQKGGVKAKHKNPQGGLTAAGRAHYKRTEGANLKPGVKGAADTPEKMRRKGSFLSRMFGSGAKGSMRDENGKPTRRALSAAAWGEPVPKDDAGRARLAAKGKRLLERYAATKKSADILDGEEPLAKAKAKAKKPAAKGAKKAPPKPAAKGKPAKESWSQKRERELNEAYKAKQAAAKQKPAGAPQGRAAGKAGPKPPASRGAPPSAPQKARAGIDAMSRAPAPPPKGVTGAPAPKGGGAAPKGGKGAKGGGAANLTTPPPGFTAIPNSKKGGFHKQTGDSWEYWYPGVGITSTPHGEDRAHAGGTSAEASDADVDDVGGDEDGGAQPPPKPAGAPPKPAAGAGQQPPAQGAGTGAGAAQGGYTAKPKITRDAQGEKRSFHPEVAAVTPSGKEGDKAYHEQQMRMHRKASKQAQRAGDNDRALAHRDASNFHAHAHNVAHAKEQGREYKPRGQYPGAPVEGEAAQGGDEDGAEGADPIAASYDRAASGVEMAGNERVTAAQPRERLVPESETVRGMREALGKGVNIMADISAAHDHLSALKAKRKEIDAKLAGKGIGSDESRLRRRLIAQIDAEMAAAKFDIVQLGDAHAEAMKQVATYEQQIRAEGIKRNPILRALMSAIEALFGKSAPKEEEQGAQASAEDTSDDAESVDEASVEMLPDDEEPSAAAQGDEEPSDEEPEDDAAAARAAGVRPDLIERFSQQGAESEDESPRADLPKPTGEDDDGIVDVNAETKRRAIEAGVSPEVLAGLEAKQDARASAERERAKRRDALDTLRRLGDSMDDAEAPPKDVQPDAGEWDRDLAEKRAKVRETEERAANLTPSQERALERRRSMVAARATRTQSGTREKERAPEAEKTKVERSARMAKSEAFARVLYLAPRVDRMLKSATAPRLVVQRRAPNFNLISLGA